MKKLLHDRLRDWAKEYPYSQLTAANDLGCSPYESIDSVFLAIADEIEKYYAHKPCNTEGNPVHKDMEVMGGVVSHWSVSEDGSWTIFDNDYEEIQCGDKDEPIRLPKPKVLDADGVPTKKGDKVWDITQEVRDNPFLGGELLVVDVTEDNIVVTPYPGCGATMSAPSSCFSHTRPQYDCNGVLCKRGDIVFGLGREQHRYNVLSEELDVEKCEPYNHGRFTLPCLDLTEGDESVCFLDPRMVSHKEPGSYEELQEMLREESPKGGGDSYEKLRDDLKRKYGSNSQWVKRLTAIMERDA